MERRFGEGFMSFSDEGQSKKGSENKEGDDSQKSEKSKETEDSEKEVKSSESEYSPEKTVEAIKVFFEKQEADLEIGKLKDLLREVLPKLNEEQKKELTGFYKQKYNEMKEEGHSLKIIFQELIDHTEQLSKSLDKQEEKEK